MSDDHGSPRGLLALVAVGLVMCLGLPALLLGGAIAIGAGAIIVGGGLIFVVAIELGMWGWWRHSAEQRRDAPATSGHRLDGSDPDRID